MAERIKYDPSHPDTNIFGVVKVGGKDGKTCRTPEGELCNACCWPYEIKEVWLHQNTSGKVVLKEEFNKSAKKHCKFEIETGGCQLHGTPLKPTMCEDFHCSRFTSRVNDPKLQYNTRHSAYQHIYVLLGVASANGNIDPEGMDETRQIWASKIILRRK